MRAVLVGRKLEIGKLLRPHDHHNTANYGGDHRHRRRGRRFCAIDTSKLEDAKGRLRSERLRGGRKRAAKGWWGALANERLAGGARSQEIREEGPVCTTESRFDQRKARRGLLQCVAHNVNPHNS